MTHFMINYLNKFNIVFLIITSVVKYTDEFIHISANLLITIAFYEH